MYTPWFREGPLYKSASNKCKEVQTVASIRVISGPLLNSGLRRLFRYGTYSSHLLGHYLYQVWDPWPGKSPM